MLKGYNIICFSNDWHQDPLSKHHIMSRMAQSNKVLWINSLGMRKPTVARQDIAKIGLKIKSFFKGIEKINNNLFVITPIVIPFHGNKIAIKINKFVLYLQIKFYQKKLKINKPILWSFLPNMVSIIGKLEEILTIYYITDDFTKFTGYPADAITVMENDLINKSD